MRATGITSLRECRREQVTGTRAFGRNLYRQHPLADEAQGLSQRARELPERAQLTDMILQCGPRSVIQRAAASRGVLHERDSRVHHRLQRNLARGVRLRNRLNETRDPCFDQGREGGAVPCILAIVGRGVLARSTRFVALSKSAEREAVGCASPPCLSSRQNSGRLPGGEPFVLYFKA